MMPVFAGVTDNNPYNVALGRTVTDVNGVAAYAPNIPNLVNGDSIDSGATVAITSGKLPNAVIEIDLADTYTLSGVDVLSGTDANGNPSTGLLKEYQIHYLSGEEWIPAKIAAGTDIKYSNGVINERVTVLADGCTVNCNSGYSLLVFDGLITTNKIRIVSKHGDKTTTNLREIRVYKADANNIAFRKPVTVSYNSFGNGGSKTTVQQLPSFVVDGQSNNTSSQEFLFGSNANTATTDHWVEIDLLKDYTINRAVVSTATTQNFSLQAYVNGGWVDIPGASVTDNKLADCELTFPEYTASKVRLFLPQGQSNQKIKEIKIYTTDIINLDEFGYESGGTPLKSLVADADAIGNMRLTNISGSPQNVTYIAALYENVNGTDKLKDVKLDSSEIPAGMSENLSVDMKLPPNIDNCTLKTFLFDTMDNIRPYFGTDKFPVLQKPVYDYPFTEETSEKILDIMDNISGAKDFTVSEPVNNGISVSVADFGASPDKNAYANLTCFENAIAKVKEINASTLIIPEGVYYLGKDRQTQISLEGISDLLIDGRGSELIFTDHETASDGQFIYINDCSRIKMSNLTIDWDFESSPTIFIGEVSAVNFNTHTVEFTAEGVNIPDSFTFGGGREWDTNVNNKVPSENYNFPSGDSVVSTAKTGTNSFSVTFKNSNYFKEVKVGSPAFLQLTPNYNANGIRTYKSKDIIFSDVTVHSVPYIAFDSTLTENLEFNRVKVVPREGRRFSSFGGLETHRIYQNVKLVNCTLDGIYDDMFHLSNSFLGTGAIKQDDYTVIFDHLQLFAHQDIIYEGAPMTMKTSQFEDINWQSEIASFEWQYNYYPGDSAAHRCVVKFKDALPADYEDTNFFFNMDFGGNYIVRNNVLRNGSCHAFYFGMDSGTVEDNTIENIAYPAFALHNVLRWSRWTIGDNPSNVIIRGNVVKGSNYAQRDPASFFIGGGYDEQPSNYTDVKGYVAHNILMEDNTIEDSAWAAFGMFSAKNVIVINNKFINSNFRESREKYEGMGNVYIYNAKDIVFAGNTNKNTVDTYESGLFVAADTTENVVIEDNVGFGDTITK
ncbi:MAG: right-handed parallel beta-helix repeat-containing protein [Clostridia bacterium]|nr:right-handed parallel beta-helix repeat-containing protein [Clostridia bacterium]